MPSPVKRVSFSVSIVGVSIVQGDLSFPFLLAVHPLALVEVAILVVHFPLTVFPVQIELPFIGSKIEVDFASPPMHVIINPIAFVLVAVFNPAGEGAFAVSLSFLEAAYIFLFLSPGHLAFSVNFIV